MVTYFPNFKVQTVYKQTSDIQSYALTLADKTRQLNQEKRRTDSLLYQVKWHLLTKLPISSDPLSSS